MRQAVDPTGTAPITRSASANVFGPILGTAGRAMRSRAALTILCLIAILPVGAIPGGFFDTSRNWLFDFYQRAAPALRVAPQTVIIDIDSTSLERIGQWPWPRDQLAKLVDAAGAARAIGIDILLAEPDRLSPGLWASARPDLAPETRLALTALPSNDALLAASIARVPVVLAAVVAPAANRNSSSAMSMMAVIEDGIDPRPALPRFAGFIPPLPELAAAARAVGLISGSVEMDGVLRRMPAITKVGAVLVPAFAVELANLASGVGRVTLGNGSAGSWIGIGEKAIRSDPQGRVWVRYAEPMPAPSVPAYRVLEGGVDPALFHDRIVLIGASAPGLGAIVATPLRHSEPGVAVQAQLIETLLAGDALWRPPATRGFELVLAFGLGIFAILLLGCLPDAIYAALLAGVAVLTVAGSFAAFRTMGLLIDWTFPAAMLAGAALFALAARVRGEAWARLGLEAALAAALRQAEFAGQLEEQATQLAKANAQLKDEAAGRQLMEEQLFRAQRIEAVGHLTGGVAHDFNNLLTVVLGNLELAVRRDMSAKARHLVVQAAVAAERGARLTSQLLAFGRKQMLTVRDVDLNALVSGVEEMLAKTLTPLIEIKLALASDLWPALADGSQLELALVNLVINAKDAAPKGGTMTIATRNISRNDIDRPGDLVPDSDDFVALTVRDTGTGMTEEVSARAFEPFFTTKEAGQGTGLGLSMVYGLMKQLGGTVQLKTRLGEGTTITLFVPRARPAQTGVDPAADRVLSAVDVPAQVRRVLLVDGDGSAREGIATMRRKLGAQVVEADNSDAALAVLDRGGPVATS
jgi:signal transduction histidine kinase